MLPPGEFPRSGPEITSAVPIPDGSETASSLGAMAGGALETAVDAHAGDAASVLTSVDSVLDSAVPQPAVVDGGAAAGGNGSELDPQSRSILEGPPANDADKFRYAEEDARVAQDLGPEPPATPKGSRNATGTAPSEGTTPVGVEDPTLGITRVDVPAEDAPTPPTEAAPRPVATAVNEMRENGADGGQDVARTEMRRNELVTERAKLQEKSEKQNLSKEEIARLKQIDTELKKPQTENDPILESARQKVKDGKADELTPEEEAKLEGAEASVEDPEEQQKKEIDQLKEVIAEKLYNGQDATDDIVALNQKLADSMGFSIRAQEEKDTREFLKGLFNTDYSKDVKESGTTRRLKKLLQDLCRKELQLRTQKTVVEKMETTAQQLKTEVNQAEDEYAKEKDPELKQQKSTVFANKSMQFSRFRDRIRAQKNIGRDLITERRNVRLEVRRALGTRSMISNALFAVDTIGLEAVFSVVDRVS